MGRKRLYAGAILASCALVFGGCAFSQETDALSTVVANDGERSYEMTQVQRGDIQKTKVIVANYQQVHSENLSFSVNGRRMAEVYVSVGDTVKKGDLLAELYCDNEKANLLSLEYEIKTQEMQIKHLQEQRDLALTQLSRREGEMQEQTYRNEVQKIEDDYRLKIEDIEDQIYIERMQYEELYQWIEGCRLYAGMDGAVTYMGEVGSEYVSRAGNKVITVSDSAECAFLCTDKDYFSYFTPQETYVFATSSGVEYETVLTDIDYEAGMMRFELTVPQYNMTIGQRVLYSLVLEEKKDVLSISKSAVHYVEDEAYVYYFDDAGDRQIKKISVGLQADSKAEVLGGLAEGEEVILR